MAGRSRVLLAYASKMGSTKEIAEVIGQELEASALQVVVAACEDNPSPADFDGVVIGSAIYTRHWLKAATRYLTRHAAQLDPHRTWLFHSGPCGEGARDEQALTPKAGGWPRKVRSRAIFETGREFEPGHQTLPIRSIRRQREGSSDGGGEIHRR
jgi:Flavodoxin domain